MTATATDTGRQEALRRGRDFLLARRDPDGFWRDYEMRGRSDHWITAYVAGVLARSPGEEALRAAHEGMDLLVGEQGEHGGWNYNAVAPEDADSTGWVLQLAEILGLSGAPWSRRGQDFLAAHIGEDGLVTTYEPALAKGVFERYPMVESWDGWCGRHLCVTAAVALLADLPQHSLVIEGLLKSQFPSGQWPAYWWVDQELSTALAVEALATVAGTQPARAAAGRWAAARIGPDGAVATALHTEGSPFATALALRTILAAGPAAGPEQARAATEWLVRSQHEDGSWTPSARLRMALPWETDPDSYQDWTLDGTGLASLGTIARDTVGLHTTATVVRALLAASTQAVA